MPKSRDPASTKPRRIRFASASTDPLIDTIQKLTRLMEGTDLVELDVRRGELRIRIRKAGAAQAVVVQAPATPLASTVPSAGPAATSPLPARLEIEPGQILVTSPFVGTFYRAPSPNAKPFVEAGEKIKKGQTLCIVEAMKLMNEVEAEVDGEIVSILRENGATVEFGEPLMIIKRG
ncbi:MAG: acetyl-CoA carboxylase biotin carboxyl carrier protein [Nitrospirae bacterium]|nr:acetyl-CoA carboxylase biotin carboxyl carrier protein [Nitrospirota bacterium]